MEAIDAQKVRDWTPRVNWAAMGYAANTEPDSLELETRLAVDYVSWVIGRPLDATMPVPLENMAAKAVALRVQQQVAEDDPEAMEALASAATLKSFNVTGYGETYQEQGATEKVQREALMVNPWPELNRLLWALMTPQRMAWWRGFLSGGGIPMWGVVEMDWSGANRWGGYANAIGGGLPGDYLGLGEGDAGFGWPALGSYPGVVAPGEPWA